MLRDEPKGKIRRFRDFAEHLDQDVIAGTLPAEMEVSIHLSETVAMLNTAQIEYADLARWIRQLHDFALRLSLVHLVIDEAHFQTKEGNDV